MQSPHLISEFVRARLNAGERPNRLIAEKSPYLLQHAFNPVDWFPWGEEAFRRAKAENKFIFLSVGYSTCYWCHVMEREVFENADIASLMNALAVNIKVDREERPDVDRVYMTAVQAMTGSGGWPMSVFLTPELEPFFGATYIPPVARHGRQGFPEILSTLAEIWEREPHRIRDAGGRIAAHLRSHESPRPAGGVDPSAPDRAFGNFSSSFDRLHAGFGGGPKFPRPSAIGFLLRYHHRTRNGDALKMALETLRAMAAGGMYDHLGGGFHRYSVDGEWRVPHFEKMLYDQAQLAVSYTEAFQITGDPFFSRVARETLAYVTRVLTSPEGGFYSAEDAESLPGASSTHKVEGACYVWTLDDIRAVIGREASGPFARHYGVDARGNAPHDPLGVFQGKNILHTPRPAGETAGEFNLTEEELTELLGRGRSALLESRDGRPRPHLDDKIICAWNGLMISAFSRAYRVFGDEAHMASAAAAARFVLERLVDPETGGLLRRYRDGEARYPGGLQDYAFLIQGLIDLYEAGFGEGHLRTAIRLAERQLALFHDDEHGGFFDTPRDDATLIVRTREDYDGAEPAGNSVSAANFFRLARMTGNDAWREIAGRTVGAMAPALAGRPDGLPEMLAAWEWDHAPVREILIVGEPGSPEVAKLAAEVHRRFLPRTVLVLAGPDGTGLPEGAKAKFPETPQGRPGTATAYLCENYACRLPTTDPETLGRHLDALTDGE